MRRRVRWHDRKNGSSSGSALRLVRISSARLRRNRWTGSSNESGTSREGPRASASRRQWKSWPRICGAGAAISAFAKRPRCWSPSLAGSGCDCGLPSGANGKHHGVGEQHSSRWESGGSCATWPAAAMDLGISPGAKPSPWDSPMPTSNRSVSHPCSARVSATSRTAVYGPVRTVVWEGRSREAPPYPDLCRVGPGNFTLSPSQIPYVNLSVHTARVTARRLPPSAEPSGSSRFYPVGPSSTAMTCPLRSTSITLASTLLRGSPPLSGASVLSASRLEPLAPFPLASPARFSRSIQVAHRHYRPAANETALDLRRAVGAEVVHWLWCA